MNTPTKQLALGEIPITLTRKRVKNINLRISQKNGEVIVSAPRSVSESYILTFLRSKIDWINERHHAAQEKAKRKLQSYNQDELHPYLGSHYPLNIVEHKRPGVSIIQDCLQENTSRSLTLYCPATSDCKQRESILDKWYRQELASRLPGIVQKWSNALGVEINEFRIKKMKTKWGTCNIQDKRIWLNLELIKYPIECIDYVVLHELTHLFERHHNRRFYQIIERHMPLWQQWENLLDQS